MYFLHTELLIQTTSSGIVLSGFKITGATFIKKYEKEPAIVVLLLCTNIGCAAIRLDSTLNVLRTLFKVVIATSSYNHHTILAANFNSTITLMALTRALLAPEMCDELIYESISTSQTNCPQAN
uniref:Uncharacterized protein n=1 Tax=Glossina pallidipes TaxID=7398 RepID=A0A1A9ZDU5_GLOPL